MLVRRYWISACVVLLVGSASCRGDTQTSPTEVVMQFYTMRDAVGVSGAPDAQELAALNPFITDSLSRRLAEADSVRTADMKRAPDEKPAFVEGDLFSSLFEGPTSYRPQPAIQSGDVTLVPMVFVYDRQPPAVTWTDTVVVHQQNGHWRVHDIRYGGTWDFGNKGSLLQSLAPSSP